MDLLERLTQLNVQIELDAVSKMYHSVAKHFPKKKELGKRVTARTSSQMSDSFEKQVTASQES